MHFSKKKVKFQKSPKYRTFPKSLVHAFCQKIELFLKCIFGYIKPEKIVSGYFKWKRFVFRPEKRTFKKVKKIEIHAFCQKIEFFFMCIFHVYFLRKSSQKRSFLDIPNTKE